MGLGWRPFRSGSPGGYDSWVGITNREAPSHVPRGPLCRDAILVHPHALVRRPAPHAARDDARREPRVARAAFFGDEDDARRPGRIGHRGRHAVRVQQNGRIVASLFRWPAWPTFPATAALEAVIVRSAQGELLGVEGPETKGMDQSRPGGEGRKSPVMKGQESGGAGNRTRVRKTFSDWFYARIPECLRERQPPGLQPFTFSPLRLDPV